MEIVNLKSVKLDGGTMAYIGRRDGHEHFGNPFGFYAGTKATVMVSSRDESVQAYEDWLAGTRYNEVEPERWLWILKNLYKLRGKTLACYCAPLPCHGSVLVKLIEKAA